MRYVFKAESTVGYAINLIVMILRYFIEIKRVLV